MIRFLPIALLLLCSSCLQLGGEVQPIRYYLLEPIAESTPVTPNRDIYLSIRPISFPGYLDRQQIVSRQLDNSLTVANQDRWAEPLGENFTRVVQENLRRSLGTSNINAAPWEKPFQQGYTLQLSINQLDGTLGQQTSVDIRWVLINSNNKTIHNRQFIARLPLGNDYSGLVNGLNQALGKLSTEIALALSEDLAE